MKLCLTVMGPESIPAEKFSQLHREKISQHLAHWVNTLSFGLNFRRLKQDVNVFHHKGGFKVRKRMLHRIA